MRADPTSAAGSPVLVWFRDDLRLADHSAVRAAAAGGRAAAACFVLDERDEFPPGGASRWWLHGSLAELERAVAERGGRLILRRGRAAAEVARLAAELGAVEIHCCKSYEPAGRASETALAATLASRGATLMLHAGVVLFDPEQLRTQSGEPFKVFTPFWNACLRDAPARPMAIPRGLQFADCAVASDELGDWRLRPRLDWAAGFAAHWQPGEHGARARLEGFVGGALADYRTERERPDRQGSSRLSAALHFGEISPAKAWSAAAGNGQGAVAFRRELGWREFARHLLWHWPSFATESFRPEFRRFPWRDDAVALSAWRRGATGYPLVDAGMRELWHTGWMHNRVRMVAASFLVKHLLIPWQTGAAWFWDALVDADLANNSVSWQWVAGSGADAAPYFRIFNPTLQARKFDPDGEYIRRWVPELARLPTELLYEPAAAPTAALRAAEVTLGGDYPEPIVAHAAARARALAAYAELRQPAKN